MSQPSTSSEPLNEEEKPLCVIVLGMAGSGKTTFVHKLVAHLESMEKSVYTVNLDPAVYHVPYRVNIDIRDTVKFKEVMKQYGFGPNGAIMTSLNFFAAQFHKVIELIGKNAKKVSYVILDTPGQIEVFTWSASGTIISESLASHYPTLVVYVMDTPRSHNPVTFMSNMMYACSVLYRMRLPFLIVLNKTDIIDSAFAVEWMRDFEAFQDALNAHNSSDGPSTELESATQSTCPGTSPYMLGLMNSMSLVLDEFYNELHCCGVSSVTGEGMDKLVDELGLARKEYYETYIPMLQKRQLKLAKSDRASKSQSAGDEHQCTDECSHPVQDSSNLKPLAMGSVYRRKRAPGRMLVDLAGDCDDAEDDPLVELDGVEENESAGEDDIEDQSMDDKFRRLCAVSASGKRE